MNILPADIWVKGSASLSRNAVEGNWYSEQNFNASKAHESNESTRGNCAVLCEKVVEPRTGFIDGNDSQGSVGPGNESDDYRRQVEDGKYRPSVISGRGASNVLENVESMALDDVVCKSSSGNVLRRRK